MRSPAETERLAQQLDRTDPLAEFRRRFYFPGDGIYLDGNSLGLLSRDAERAVLRVLAQWRTRRSAATHCRNLIPGITWARNSERSMAPLVGAEPNEVVVTGTTTVNLHQMLATFYRPEGKRKKIVATALDFPSDVHAFQSQVKLHGGDPHRDLILVPSRDGRMIEEDDVIAAMDERTAVAVLPSVLYRSGQLLDIGPLAKAAREKDVLIGFDCSHSVGVVPHALSEAGVDFAVWCGYKYLNGGPGTVGASTSTAGTTPASPAWPAGGATIRPRSSTWPTPFNQPAAPAPGKSAVIPSSAPPRCGLHWKSSGRPASSASGRNR